ncbi:MAG: FHA domain-containing protein [Myxococcota bacterium]
MAILRIRTPVVGQEERVFDWAGQPITLGRETTCDVVLLEQAASRQHARLERRDDEILVSDQGSANGTWVGTERITTRALHDGEIFRIGNTTIQLVLDPHGQPTLVGASTPAPDQPEADAPDPREILGTGPTLAASEAAALAQAPARSHAPDPIREGAITDRPTALDVAEVTASAPELPGSTTPHDAAASASWGEAASPHAAAPEAYSLGEAAALGPSESAAYSMGATDPARPDPPASSPSVYSLGPIIAPPSNGPPDGPDGPGGPDGLDGPRPPASSPSVYSLGPDLGPPVRGPETLGLGSSSSPSVYSLGPDPDAEPGPLQRSAPSNYSLGNAAPLEGRGPDTPIAPPPPARGPASSAALGAPPPPPPAPLAGPKPEPAFTPRLFEPPSPPQPLQGPSSDPPIGSSMTSPAPDDPSPIDLQRTPPATPLAGRSPVPSPPPPATPSPPAAPVPAPSPAALPHAPALDPLAPPSPLGGPALHPRAAAPLPAAPSPSAPLPAVPLPAAPSPAARPLAFASSPHPAPDPRAHPAEQSSWGWIDPDLAPPTHPRSESGHAAGPTLWLGIGLFIGGLVAMAVALGTGYDPADLLTLLGGVLWS